MQPYSVFLPECRKNGVIFNSPHSGVCLPDEFLEQISIDPSLLHYSSDFLVDQLIKDTPLFGATCIINHIARTYVDTNRSPREIDPEMFQSTGQKNNFINTSKVSRGFGIFSRKSYNGQEIYQKKLPFSEINHRLDLIYNPVHKALSNLLDSSHKEHGFHIMLDCHSMPSYEFIDPELSNAKQPDLIIGNCFDSSCSKHIAQYVADYFAGHGLKVAFNVPYSGGFNTQNYGRPEEMRNTLQLEFSRAIYMDEKTLTPHEGFTSLQLLLTGLSEDLNQNLSSLFPSK